MNSINIDIWFLSDPVKDPMQYTKENGMTKRPVSQNAELTVSGMG